MTTTTMTTTTKQDGNVDNNKEEERHASASSSPRLRAPYACPYATAVVYQQKQQQQSCGIDAGSFSSSIHSRNDLSPKNSDHDSANNNNHNQDETNVKATATSTINNNNDDDDDDLVTVTKRQCPAFAESRSCPFKNAKSAHDVRQTLLQIPPSHYTTQGLFYKVLQELHHSVIVEGHQNNNNNNNEKDVASIDTNDDNNNQKVKESNEIQKWLEESNEFKLPGGCPMMTMSSSSSSKMTLTNTLNHPTNNDNNNDSWPKARTSHTTTNAATTTTTTTTTFEQEFLSFTAAMEQYSLAAIMAHLASQEEAKQQQENSIPTFFRTDPAGAAEASSSQDEPPSGASLGTVQQREKDTIAGNGSQNIPHQTAADALKVDSDKHASKEETHGDLDDETTASTAPTETDSIAVSSPTSLSARDDPITTSTIPSLTLSKCLKSGTAISHKAAEDVHFVRNFIRGKIDRHLYGQMVMMLYHVYRVLEDLLDRHATHYFATCHFPLELARTSALQEDVDFWHGPTTIDTTTTMSPATRDYVDRLKFIAETNPLLLLSHSYTRYLGDLSGGMILARVARKALNLSKPSSGSSGTGKAEVDGLAFYHFANIPSPKQFKTKYRQALDALPLTDAQVHQLVGEANVAFLLNMRLFEELDVMANVPGATVRPLQEALEFAQSAPEANENGSVIPSEKSSTSSTTISAREASSMEKCPFANPALTRDMEQKVVASSQRLGSRQAGKNGGAGASCPWPFILLHDPVKGMTHWQTWAVLGLCLAWLWSRYVAQSS